MKNRMTWFAAAMAVMLMVSCAARGGADGWVTNFDTAKQMAAKQGVPILADFSGSDWCGWCMKLEREVFSQKEFADFARKDVVLFLADFPSRTAQPEDVIKQNKALAEKYKIEGFPTVLILDAQGKELARTGYQAGGAAAYVAHLKGLMKK